MTTTESTMCAAIFAALTMAGCTDGEAPGTDLTERAYVVSEGSNELFVADLATLQPVASVDTGIGDGVNGNHMAVVSAAGDKVYITAAHRDALVVVDARSLEVARVVQIGASPTHANACFGCGRDGADQLWVAVEGDNAVAVVDMATDQVIDVVAHDSMVAPHFARFYGGRAYVPSIGGNQITVIDVGTRDVVDVVLAPSVAEPGACSEDPCGFADAQIDSRGVMMAAHIETGAVVVYDAVAGQRLADVQVGNRPWAVFVDPLSHWMDTYMMPNWGDATVSVFDRVELAEVARSPAGDYQSYGVNYSPLAPDAAFVLNRSRHRVAVDRSDGHMLDAIDVGGTTETASTTADGRYLLVPVSSAGAFSVIDVVTRGEVARFNGVGDYPWSVTTVGGQNYCH